jgi:HlyD family secretion protein
MDSIMTVFSSKTPPLFLIFTLASLLLSACRDKELPPLIGMVETREIMVASKLAGRLAAVLVAEGDSVTEGQLVARLSSPEVMAKVEQARGAVKSAGAKLTLVRKGAREEELRIAQTSLNQTADARKLATDSLSRLQKLIDQGMVTRQKLDEANYSLLAAQQAESAAAARFEMLKNGSRPEERDAAEGTSQSATNALVEAESWHKEMQVNSPTSGRIQKLYLAAGEIAVAGSPILVIIRPEDAWVAVAAREDQLPGLQIGNVLKGELPALGLKDVEFKVTWLTAMGDFATWRATSRKGDTDLRSFEVRLEPVKPVPGMLPGMTVRLVQTTAKSR